MIEHIWNKIVVQTWHVTHAYKGYTIMMISVWPASEILSRVLHMAMDN